LQAVRRAVQKAGATIVFEKPIGSPSVALRNLAYARTNHALIQSRLFSPSTFTLVAVKPG
jgi:hypothetical protein